MTGRALVLGSIALAVAVVSQAANAQRPYVRKGLYPAHVRSVSFTGGLVLDANHPLVQPTWTIAFAKPLPKAVYYDGDRNNAPQVEIQDLLCLTREGARMSCGLSIPGDDRPCMLLIDSEPDQIPDFVPIACPAAIVRAGP